MMNMDVAHSGGEDFDMSSAIEDHMSEEDLGPEAGPTFKPSEKILDGGRNR